MSELHARLQPVRSQQQWVWTLQCAAWGLLGASVLGLIASILRLAGAPGLSPWAIVGILAAGPVIGAAVAFALCRSFHQAALAVDRHYDLKDRSATALAFLAKGVSSPVHELQISDALSHLSRVNPRDVAPWKLPRTLPFAGLLSVLAVALLLVSIGSQKVQAGPETNDVVVAQADRAAEELKELEEFNKEENDPELEKLLKELKVKIDELKQPGVDPKEALAKLSEMQAALQEQQAQLNTPAMDAQFQAVGEALSLAEPLEAAGNALSAGEMEKAAEELEKLEKPELDRQTEKAVTEKLEAAKKQMDKTAMSKLSEAVGNITQGLSSGNGSKFKDGAKGLASEAKKQGKRKKLSDLLRKQCNCLGECKSECEGECKSTANGKGKGGNKWGLGASGNEPGDKTAKLATKPQMQLKGKQGEQGDVDVETTHSPEARQEAQRDYSNKFRKYQEINESVLDNEPIPLGHRQTIRKYFELIRPQEGETDKVNEAVEGK